MEIEQLLKEQEKDFYHHFRYDISTFDDTIETNAENVFDWHRKSMKTVLEKISERYGALNTYDDTAYITLDDVLLPIIEKL